MIPSGRALWEPITCQNLIPTAPLEPRRKLDQPLPSNPRPPPPQVSYNADGVFVSWVAICREGLPNNQVQSSAMVYSFPKWAVYSVSLRAGGIGHGRV